MRDGDASCRLQPSCPAPLRHLAPGHAHRSTAMELADDAAALPAPFSWETTVIVLPMSRLILSTRPGSSCAVHGPVDSYPCEALEKLWGSLSDLGRRPPLDSAFTPSDPPHRSARHNDVEAICGGCRD
jgi:hypothetical protein